MNIDLDEICDEYVEFRFLYNYLPKLTRMHTNFSYKGRSTVLCRVCKNQKLRDQENQLIQLILSFLIDGHQGP